MRNYTRWTQATVMYALMLSLGATAALAETTGQYIDDATISTKVKAAIMADSTLKGSSVSVTTDKATVELTGLVISSAQEKEAVRVAQQVNGVKDVQDHMTVRGTQSQ